MITHCLVSRSWVVEGLSAAALAPSLSLYAPGSASVGNYDGGLWSASGIACVWIALYEN